MTSMDAFAGSAFDTVSLTGQVQKIDFVPNLLGSLGLFTPEPVRTRNIFVDKVAGKVTLIPTTESGAPVPRKNSDPRNAISLRTVRIAEGFELRASELSGIRAHGSETELETVANEFLRRSARVAQDMDLTHEFHRLGALQGKLLDADGTTVIYDYFAQFGASEPTAFNFALNVDTTKVRKKCQDVVRAMKRAAKGAFVEGVTTIHALAGDGFFDSLIDHPNVTRAYENYSAAQDLTKNKAFEAFTYGGITWHNYRGTDDNSTVAIPSGEAKFFPVGARDMFQKAMSPHETMEFVNTLGAPLYAERRFEREGNPRESTYVAGDLYSYPLYLCQQPEVLQKAVAQ